jgi:hypothetical protein
MHANTHMHDTCREREREINNVLHAPRGSRHSSFIIQISEPLFLVSSYIPSRARQVRTRKQEYTFTNHWLKLHAACVWIDLGYIDRHARVLAKWNLSARGPCMHACRQACIISIRSSETMEHAACVRASSTVSRSKGDKFLTYLKMTCIFSVSVTIPPNGPLCGCADSPRLCIGQLAILQQGRLLPCFAPDGPRSQFGRNVGNGARRNPPRRRRP